MSTFRIKYKNKKFIKERIELDGHFYEHCDFEGCLIILEKGETEIETCTFKGCRLMLMGQALRIAKILQVFIKEKPLRVLHFTEPGILGQKDLTAEHAEDAEKKS